MADIALIVGLVSIFAAVVIVLATIGVLTGEREQVGRSLAAVQAFQAAPASMRSELDRPFKARVIDPLVSNSTGLGRRLTPAGQIEKLRKRLDAAGSPAGWDVERILAFKVLGALAGVIATILLSPIFLSFGIPFTIVIGLILLVAGFFAPNMVLYQRAYNRADRMRKELPDALDLLTISVEAGLAFDAAMSQVARQTEGPLAEEFFRVLQEMQIGMGRIDAFKATTSRPS
jgi:tight adherence protein C